MPISVRTPIIIFYYSKDFDKTSNEKKIWDQFKESVNEYGNFTKINFVKVQCFFCL